VQLLSHVAAGSALPPLAFVRDNALAAKIEAARAAALDLADFCRARLIDLVLSMDSDMMWLLSSAVGFPAASE
jgi:hypothetical protein